MKIVILAGGSGTRLWPISRGSFPKQFLKLGGEFSLLQRTVQRFFPQWPAADILIITNEEHQFLVKTQIGGIDAQLKDQIVIEPVRKNTAPAIALAIKHLQENQGVKEDDVIFISSSDHWIAPEEQFLELLNDAEAIAKRGKIVAFGVTPNKPETGYGYIQVKKTDTPQELEAVSFVEKPNLETAERYLLSGNYLWNSGMFAFSIQTFWEEIEKYCPALLQLQKGAKFSDMPDISFDYAIMEKSQRIAVMPLNLTWSDIGSWDTIFDMMEKDKNNNVKIGNVYDIDTKNSLIFGGKRLISTIGLESMIVIETEDALFLGKKGESQKVKALVEELKKYKKNEVQNHITTFRPWGQYTILEEGSRYKVKRIVVEPMQRLSLQMHFHRSEHWVVVKGTAKATIGENSHLLHENESIYVPKSMVHRLENPGKVALELIEVQVGEYVGEDDIVRFEDVYGRVEQEASPIA